MATPTQRCRFHHSAEEWERQKPFIVKYYLDQGNFIERTMNIMKKKHNFIASRRMYMKMLSTWKLGKHLKCKPTTSKTTSHRSKRPSSPQKEVLNVQSTVARIQMPPSSTDIEIHSPNVLQGLDEAPSFQDDLGLHESVEKVRELFDHVNIGAAPPPYAQHYDDRYVDGYDDRYDDSGMKLQKISCDPRWREQQSLSGQTALLAARRCHDLGNLDAAEEYCKAAWRSSPLSSSAEGCQALQAYNYLAFIHAEKREFTVAEAEFTEILDHSRILYGLADLRTVSALSSLAKVYSLQEKYAQAEQLLIQVYHIHQSSSETDSRPTLNALKDLAQNHFRQEQYELAKSEQQRVVDRSRASFGPADVFTEESLWSLLQMYHNQGTLDELEQSTRRQFNATKHLLDEDAPCPDALWTLRCLTYIHMLQDHFKEALEESMRLSLLSKRLDERLLIAQEVVEPSDERPPTFMSSPLTLIFETHVSSMLLVSGLYEQCLMLNRRLLPQLVATYDFDHKATLNCIAILGQCNLELGSFKEAKKLVRRAVDGFRKLRDRRHVLQNSIRLLTCVAEEEAYHAPEFVDLAVSSMANMDLADRVGSLDAVELALKFLAKRRDIVSFRYILGETLPAIFQALDSMIGSSRQILTFMTYCASELSNLGQSEMADELVSRLAYAVIILDPKPRVWSKKALECIGLYELRHENWKDAEMYLLAAKIHSISLLGPVHAETRNLEEPIATASRNLHVSKQSQDSDIRRSALSSTSVYYDLLLRSSLFAFRCRSDLIINNR